jgi:pimeloyl-ACP methyl ester carboxylesterase
VLPDGERQKVDWFGTSMGGLIGMGLASLPGNPIRKLVLNDIGPVLAPMAMQRIGDYIGQDLRFEASRRCQVHPTFRCPSAAHRSRMAQAGPDVLRQDKDGKWVRHYDMGLALPFRSATPESADADQAMLWAAYDAIPARRCWCAAPSPTCCRRKRPADDAARPESHAGGNSRRGPRADLYSRRSNRHRKAIPVRLS